MVAAHIVGVGEELAAGRKRIEVRRLDLIVSIKPDSIVGEVVREDEEEVRLFLRNGWHERKAQNECNLGKEISHGSR